VRKGGLVNLFAGCPAGTLVGIDAQRIHYDEVTITSTFHHTPQDIREALRLLGSGVVDPRGLISAEAPLEALPQILGQMPQGDGLKTMIVP
jgi:L-iditol 2-dehydrogenase